MTAQRRLAFAHARTPAAGARRSVAIDPRKLRRLAPRHRTPAGAPMPPRGCEDLH
jgi:hypothetical protein